MTIFIKRHSNFIREGRILIIDIKRHFKKSIFEFKKIKISLHIYLLGTLSFKEKSHSGNFQEWEGRSGYYRTNGNKAGQGFGHAVGPYRVPGNPHNQSSQEKQEHGEQESL